MTLSTNFRSPEDFCSNRNCSELLQSAKKWEKEQPKTAASVLYCSAVCYMPTRVDKLLWVNLLKLRIAIFMSKKYFNNRAGVTFKMSFRQLLQNCAQIILIDEQQSWSHSSTFPIFSERNCSMLLGPSHSALLPCAPLLGPRTNFWARPAATLMQTNRCLAAAKERSHHTYIQGRAAWLAPALGSTNTGQN